MACSTFYMKMFFCWQKAAKCLLCDNCQIIGIIGKRKPLYLVGDSDCILQPVNYNIDTGLWVTGGSMWLPCEWVTEYMNEWVMEWVNEGKVSAFLSKWMNGQTDKETNGQTGRWEMCEYKSAIKITSNWMTTGTLQKAPLSYVYCSLF